MFQHEHIGHDRSSIGQYQLPYLVLMPILQPGLYHAGTASCLWMIAELISENSATGDPISNY